MEKGNTSLIIDDLQASVNYMQGGWMDGWIRTMVCTNMEDFEHEIVTIE